MGKFRIKHRPIKRTFDLLFSFLMLLVFFPVFLIIAIAIRLTSKGSPVYTHQRIGRGGKPFLCYKFRTMYADADERLARLLDENPKLQKEWQQTRKLKDDPRITPIGRFLRKTSLDEFPQFCNVIRGDLSVVGPRPVVNEEIVNYYGEKAFKILSMRPGLTCLWQVSGRNDVSYSKRVELDEQYIDNHSLLLDLNLILKTVPTIILSKGAY